MNDVMTEIVAWGIARDDGDVMERGFPDRAAAEKRIREMYDPGEYVPFRSTTWVPAEPLPLYERRNPLAALAAWLRGDDDPWWKEVP